MLRFVDDCGHEAIRANIDISHLVLAGEPPEAVRRLRGKAIHVHISDCDGRVHGDLPPGRGVVPFEPYLREIKSLGLDGTMSIEYHSKLSAKQPRVGGAWEWHQDYGYWYKNGCLFPDMLSVFIAIDACTKENGCMQVLRGAHLLGRIEHGFAGEQTGADLERVAEAKKRLELVYCEMAPGTALFFHGNTLHTSDANLSEHPRWGLICCYNTKHNDPYKEHHHPRYTPLTKVPDSAIKALGAKPTEAAQRFLKQDDDDTTRRLETGATADA
jgi:hypothetical protein